MKTTLPGFFLAALAPFLGVAPFAHSAETAAPGSAAAANPPGATKPTPKPRKAEDASTPASVNAGRQKAFLERSNDKGIQLVFLGDSITDFWQNRGKAVWEQYYAKYDAANFGVSGEHTEHTLGHIAGGILDRLRPKVVVIMIGTNNIGHIADEKPEWTAAGIREVVNTVHVKLADTKVLLLGVFPREGKESRHRKQIEEINAIISKLDDGKKTRYLDLTSKFTDAGGNIPKSIMPDGLHPNAEGYKIWAEAMHPLLTEMLK